MFSWTRTPLESHLNRAFTKSEHVYEQLRERAKYGRLRPLRRLKPADLDREFRAGITPARDALLRLHAEGFVRSDAGRGYWTKAYRAKEQRDIQTMLLMCAVYSADAAGRLDPARLRMAANQFREAIGGSLDGAGEALAWTRVEAQDSLFRQLAEISGNEIVARLVRNAVDRTHFPRVIDAADAQVADRAAGHIDAICKAGLAGNLEAAVTAAAHLAQDWADRLEAVVERANARIADAKFP